MNPIPNDATPGVKEGFRSVWKAIDSLGKRDVNFHGSRIINAGDAREGSEYLTLRQFRTLSRDPQVVREVLTIVETGTGTSPWERVGAAIIPVNASDQVWVGSRGGPGSTIPKLYVMGANGVVPSVPTFAAADYMVLENATNANFAFVIGATSNASIKWFGSGDASVDGRLIYNRNTRAMTIMTATVDRVQITAAGSVLLAVAGALATTAVDGFTYIPSCAGAPTGVPTAQTGMVPLVYDSTNNVFYVRSGGTWRTH